MSQSDVKPKRVRIKKQPTKEEVKAQMLEQEKDLRTEIQELEADELLVKPLATQLKIVPELLNDALEDAKDELEQLLEDIKELDLPEQK